MPFDLRLVVRATALNRLPAWVAAPTMFLDAFWASRGRAPVRLFTRFFAASRKCRLGRRWLRAIFSGHAIYNLENFWEQGIVGLAAFATAVTHLLLKEGIQLRNTPAGGSPSASAFAQLATPVARVAEAGLTRFLSATWLLS